MSEKQAEQENRLLAVDPSLRETGYALLCRQGKKMQALEFGTIVNPAKLKQSECLVRISGVIEELLKKYSPAQCAMEGVIYVQSYRTAITMGAARAAAVLPVARAGIPIHEYAPRRVKQAVAGRGAAKKEQVAFMVRALLELTVTPEPDAADALAIGITHYRASESALAGTAPKI